MYDLPTSIYINDREYPIRNHGDYRMVIDCFIALNDSELDKSHRIATSLIIFYDGMDEDTDLAEFFGDDLESAIREMFLFMNCGQPESAKPQSFSVFNWKTDAQLISGSVNAVAGKELRAEPYVHWWTFMGYYSAIGESPLATILGIREKIVKGKPLEKYEKEYRMNNPGYFNRDYRSTEQISMEEEIKNLWNKGN